MNDFGDLISSGRRKDPIIFNFNFDYFNSASAKCILDILYEETGKWREEKDEDQTDDITIIGIRI
jgi:hypothetical protein